MDSLFYAAELSGICFFLRHDFSPARKIACKGTKKK